MKTLRGRKLAASLALALALSTVTAGAASARPRQPPQTSSVYYQCSTFMECMEFAYYGYFLK